jgi:phosphoribosylformylglycinamidine (FGAM) synthase-like enzyme
MSKKNEITQVFSIFGDPNVQFKRYESLVPKNEYDREKAETLAEAMTELVTINNRKHFLESLLEENKALKPFLWKSMDGKVQALHKIDDGHFRSIINYLMVTRMVISKEVRAEAATRGVEVPANYVGDDEDDLDW